MRCIMLITAGLLLGACSPYVNIPRQPGDMAAHNPNDGTARRISAVALKHLVDQRTTVGQYTVALPSGTKRSTYQWVITRLPEGANAVDYKDTGVAPIFMVASIYVRGTDGQVDVIITRHDGSQRLASVYCESGAAGWYVVNDRMWQMPVSEALRLAYPHRTIDPTYLEPKTSAQ